MTKKKKNKRGKCKHDISTAKLEPASIKEKRGVIQKIKEFIRKHPISFTVTVGLLSSLITIYQFWTSPEDKARVRIESHVCTIRETFNRVDMQLQDKTIRDYEVIKDFQHTALSFVNYWKAVEAIRPLEKSRGFENADTDLRNLYLEREAESQRNKYRMLLYSFHEVKNKIYKIILYGQKHHIYEYTYSADRWNNINRDLDIIEQLVDETKEQSKDRWEIIKSKRNSSKCSSSDNLLAKELSYMMEPYYKMFDSMEILEIVEEFLSYIIDLNASSMSHLTKGMVSQQLNKKHISINL